MQFKEIYEISKALIRMYEERTDIFLIPKQNKSQTILKLSKFIYTRSRAALQERKDINEYSHPSILE